MAGEQQDLPAKESPSAALGNRAYEKELKLQRRIAHQGLKVCIAFEGLDGAGKGGTIKAITEREKSQMYVQRYIGHLPAAGEVVIFDRSWYNRAGVEKVMGFCTPEQATRFLAAVPGVERAMVDSGIILLKYWLEVSPEEQARRLRDRISDGRKTWKLSPMDVKSFTRWDDYTQARDEMFAASDSSWAPWFVARSEDKKRVRLNVISHLLKHVPYEAVETAKVKLPKRKIGVYRSVDYPFKYIPECLPAVCSEKSRKAK